MKKIMILALLFPPLAYGKGRVPRSELPLVTIKNRQIVVEGKGRTITFPVVKGVPEEVQLETAQAAEAVEGCERACFTNMIQITSKETPFDSPEYRAMQAIRQSPVYLKDQDAVTVRDTVKHAKNIVGVRAEEKQGALVNASFISRDWNDPVAQNKIPETAESWAYESEVTEGASTLIGTMVVFDLDSEEQAEQREEKIMGNCQAGVG